MSTSEKPPEQTTIRGMPICSIHQISWGRCDCAAALANRTPVSALTKALAVLNPLSGFLKRRSVKMERYLESVRDEIRRALQECA